MTEQKYRLTVNTLKYEDPWVFDGTLKDIIEQLERVHGDQDDPLEWASEAGVALPYPEDEEYGRLPPVPLLGRRAAHLPNHRTRPHAGYRVRVRLPGAQQRDAGHQDLETPHRHRPIGE